MKAKSTMTLLLILAVVVTLTLIGLRISIDNNIRNNELSITNRESGTSLVLKDVSYINGSLIEGNDWFYWLFPSDTIQVKNAFAFLQLARNLHVSSFYYETDKEWHSKFGFTVHGGSSYGFDDVNFIFKIDGTDWVWGED